MFRKKMDDVTKQHFFSKRKKIEKWKYDMKKKGVGKQVMLGSGVLCGIFGREEHVMSSSFLKRGLDNGVRPVKRVEGYMEN